MPESLENREGGCGLLSSNSLFLLGLFARGIVTGARFQHVGLQERKVYGKVPASWRIHRLRDSFAIYRGISSRLAMFVGTTERWVRISDESER